jgi:uncharacterized protein (TIGR03067 family)
MKRTFPFLLAFSHALFALAADKTTDGAWKPTAAMLGGIALDKSALDAITLKLSSTNYEVTVTGEAPDRGTSTFDITTDPKHLTIVSTNGPNRGKTFLAIYEMKDDQSLRICYDLSGTAFPTEFKAPEGTRLFLASYRRQTESPATSAPKSNKTEPQPSKPATTK